MGSRTWNMDKGTVYLEQEDVERGALRLKEFADVNLTGSKAIIHSFERSDKRSIVHWITEENSTEGTLLSTSNNEIITQNGRLEKHSLKTGTIVQLERIGYARLQEDGSFILCHEASIEEK
ncbi:MAG: hypothetical protein HOI79_08215, partial [Euryarchaeota archaeon]|nr:hypothetical protein [Euryarchaeota archaeon]